MRKNSLRFVVLPALVILIASLAACKSPTQPKTGEDFYRVTVKIVPVTCQPGGAAGWCNRVTTPIRFYGEWGAPYHYRGVEVVAMPDGSFQIIVDMPTGRLLEIKYSDPGLCVPNQNCIDPYTGIGLWVNGVPLHNRMPSTTVTLSRDGTVNP